MQKIWVVIQNNLSSQSTFLKISYYQLRIHILTESKKKQTISPERMESQEKQDFSFAVLYYQIYLPFV